MRSSSCSIRQRMLTERQEESSVRRACAPAAAAYVSVCSLSIRKRAACGEHALELILVGTSHLLHLVAAPIYLQPREFAAD
jgi:hypothetical protein